MLGLQMVTMTMDTTPLGRIGNVEAVDLFNQPNRQLLWALDFKTSSPHKTPRQIAGLLGGGSLSSCLSGGSFVSVTTPRGHGFRHSPPIPSHTHAQPSLTTPIQSLQLTALDTLGREENA
jgi:hypothetical protein